MIPDPFEKSYHITAGLALTRSGPRSTAPRPKLSQSPGGSAMTLSLPANRRVGHVILGLDRLTSHAAQMDREPELKIIRRAFAKLVMAAGGVSDPRVEAAFSAVAR